jgi:hypothetical protein
MERIMMRRTVLLLATTALALIAAGGIALAATLITCTTNPCDGTTEDDVITGTVDAETINGRAGNDEISARDANDTINGEDGNDTMHGELGDDQLNGDDSPDHLFGEDGADRMNGGAGDDDLTGGLGNDRYFVTTNWGSDTITDGGGNNDFIGPVPDGATAAAMPPLTVNLVSGTGPEYTDGNGNTVNWNDDAIGSVSTGAGDDVISQRPKNSNGMTGGAGSDTYTGYTTEPFGGDSIGDSAGPADVLDISSRSLASARWTTPKYPSTSNVQGLQIDFHGGPFLCIEEFCDYITIGRYFDNTSTDVCASGPGPGVIETIKFADDPRVDFAQVKSLAASHDRTDNNRDGNTDEPGETCPAPTEEDTTPPTVTDVVPTDGEQNVATGTVVESGFSEAMNPDTINTSTFTLTEQDSSTPVEATVGYETYNPTYGVASLYPNSELAPNTTYTATIKGGASGAKDPAGNALEQDHSWSFTTGADTTPPETFIGSGPSDGSYVRSTSASFSFSSDESDATFECKLNDGVFESCTSPKEYTDLSEGSHIFEVRATDPDGNTDPTHASREWTVDTTAPTSSTVSPNDQTRNVSPDTNVEATFAEAMDSGTVNTNTFTLGKRNADGSTTPVAATVGYDSTTKKATLDPSSDLASSATYTATIMSGSNGVKDLAGNALGQNLSWTFTTAPPSVVSYTPTETTGVPRNIRPTATFSTNMDPSTITATNIKFEVYDTKKRAWVSVSRTVSYDATSKTATVSPGSTLAAAKNYRVTVTTNVKSSTGVALDQDVNTSGNQPKSWTFTTGTLSAYSAVGNFSATQNPSGAWSYGYRASAGSGFVLYASHARPWGSNFDQWSLYDSPFVTPHVTYNRSGQTASYSTITHPPDVLNLHPGDSGQKSVVRWTAPSSVTVKIEGRFEGIDTHGTTTDVAVVKNFATSSPTTLFSDNIDFYGDRASFSFTTSVRAGDTINFVVGYGSNANHGFDSTGLSATITY